MDNFDRIFKVARLKRVHAAAVAEAEKHVYKPRFKYSDEFSTCKRISRNDNYTSAATTW